MTKLIPLVLVCLCVTYISNAQIIQPGTKVDILPGTKLLTNRTINIGDNATLNNNGDIYFAGDLYNNGNKNLTGNFIAKGEKNQVIGGADSFSIANLALANSKGASLNSKVAIINNLNLQSGVLYTSDDNPILFTATAQSPQESIEQGYIYGTAVMEPRNVGTGELSFLGTYISAGSDLGSVSIVRKTGENAIKTIGASNSIASNWEINTTVKEAEGHNVSFSWISVFDNEQDVDKLILFGNVKFDTSRYISLDRSLGIDKPLTTNFVTKQHTYSRVGLDYIDRKYTLANILAQVNTIEKVKITTFPNPANDHINLLLENFEGWATGVRIRLTDAYGKVISEKVYPLNGNLITIDNLGSLAQGVYRLLISRGQKTELVNFFKS